MTPCHDQGSPPWADLPPELLGMVFIRLPTRADRARFPAVCRQWGSAAQQETVLPLPSPMPWLVLPDGSAISFPHSETFHLPQGTCYHNSYGEWILLSREDDTCFLMNPFTKATMEIPNLSSYSPYYEPVVTDNDHVPNYGMPGTWMDFMGSKDVSAITLIVCSTRLIAAVLSVGDCGEYFCTIALCPARGCRMVCISEFEVLKADFGCSLWTGTRSLGVDLALFLGRGCSRAVRVSPDDLSRGCIFFVDDYIDGWYWKNTTTSCGVYDMKDGKVYSPMPKVSWKSGKVPATWLFSQGNLD
ncbi:hypothetical protein QOZ80_5BG0426350 [Eleusine coracana subsp. coracana]|nr:hypothetical protein QOZ80_5BG0426350 [Eleusine coracana subsp. coracana]